MKYVNIAHNTLLLSMSPILCFNRKITNLMCVTSNQYSDAVSNMAKRKIYSDLHLQLTNEIACYMANCIRKTYDIIDSCYVSLLVYVTDIKGGKNHFVKVRGSNHFLSKFSI